MNLNWDAPKKKGGFFGMFADNTPPDLDLGCMFALSDGPAGVIQPPGNRFGRRPAVSDTPLPPPNLRFFSHVASPSI